MKEPIIFIPRYEIDRPDIWGDYVVASDDGPYVLWDDVKPILEELESLRRYRENIAQALNEGDGVYRP